jgi:hypothetical protein
MRSTYVLGGGIALQVRLDRLVLLVELGQIGHEILDNVCVWQWVDARLLGGVGGNAACPVVNSTVPILPQPRDHIHKQARVLTPSMFIAQLPQIPSRQLLRKVRVGSISFLIRMSASSIIGPVLLRSSSYVCILGFSEGASGFQR